MTIKPLHDRLLVKRKDPEEKSRGGLFLPTVAQEKSSFAVVVAVGPGRIDDNGKRVAMRVEPGMTVLLSKWAGDEIEIDGEKHLFLRETDVLAVLM
jgi:chaperonin GroES